MKRKNWLVADHGIRPKGKPDECFYCGAKEDDINSLCEGPCCANNIISDLEEMMGRFEESGRGCLCGTVSQKYIREATERDEQEHHLYVMKLPS